MGNADSNEATPEEEELGELFALQLALSRAREDAEQAQAAKQRAEEERDAAQRLLNMLRENTAFTAGQITSSAAPLELQVCGLSGILLTVVAERDWSVRRVKEAILDRIGTPLEQQVLVAGEVTMSDEAAPLATVVPVVGLPAAGCTLQLTLVRQEQLPAPDALLEAIHRGNAAAALALLMLPKLPGLNDAHPRSGFNVLHEAAIWRLEDVALAILARPDFLSVNALAADYIWTGATALHLAASEGLVRLCAAIAQHPDFNQLHAGLRGDGPLGWRGATAADIARNNGQHQLVQMLEPAAH